jgi:hypothetical protein
MPLLPNLMVIGLVEMVVREDLPPQHKQVQVDSLVNLEKAVGQVAVVLFSLFVILLITQ